MTTRIHFRDFRHTNKSLKIKNGKLILTKACYSEKNARLLRKMLSMTSKQLYHGESRSFPRSRAFGNIWWNELHSPWWWIVGQICEQDGRNRTRKNILSSLDRFIFPSFFMDRNSHMIWQMETCPNFVFSIHWIENDAGKNSSHFPKKYER